MCDQPFTKVKDSCHSLYIHSEHTVQHADNKERKTGQQAEVNILWHQENENPSV